MIAVLVSCAIVLAGFAVLWRASPSRKELAEWYMDERCFCRAHAYIHDARFELPSGRLIDRVIYMVYKSIMKRWFSIPSRWYLDRWYAEWLKANRSGHDFTLGCDTKFCHVIFWMYRWKKRIQTGFYIECPPYIVLLGWYYSKSHERRSGMVFVPPSRLYIDHVIFTCFRPIKDIRESYTWWLHNTWETCRRHHSLWMCIVRGVFFGGFSILSWCLRTFWPKAKRV